MTARSIPLAMGTRLGAQHLRLAGELLRFGLVGALGFLVDSSVLLVGIAVGLGPWWGRVLSYLAAASTTFALNRAWTFRDRAGARRSPPVRQWALFLLVNLAGFLGNYGAYAALMTASQFVAAHPVLGVAAGSVVGLAANFVLSRKIVFAGEPGVRPHQRP